MFVSRDVIFDEQTFSFGANLVVTAPNLSQEAYHHCWDSDEVQDDDRKREQRLVGFETPTAGLSPPETSGNFGCGSSVPGAQPLTGLSSTGPKSQPRLDDKGSPRSGPVQDSCSPQGNQTSGPPVGATAPGSTSTQDAQPLVMAQPNVGAGLSDAAGLTRQQRARKMPSHLQDYVCYSARSPDSSRSSTAPHSLSKVSSGNPYPIAN